jgi:hypothetical protein
VKRWRRGLLAPWAEFDGVVAQRLDEAITDAMAPASIPARSSGSGTGGSYVKALGLDAPVSKYIDGVPDGDAITSRQLTRMQIG